MVTVAPPVVAEEPQLPRIAVDDQQLAHADAGVEGDFQIGFIAGALNFHEEVWPASRFDVLADAGNGVVTQDFIEKFFPNWNFLSKGGSRMQATSIVPRTRTLEASSKRYSRAASIAAYRSHNRL